MYLSIEKNYLLKLSTVYQYSIEFVLFFICITYLYVLFICIDFSHTVKRDVIL